VDWSKGEAAERMKAAIEECREVGGRGTGSWRAVRGRLDEALAYWSDLVLSIVDMVTILAICCHHLADMKAAIEECVWLAKLWQVDHLVLRIVDMITSGLSCPRFSQHHFLGSGR
jgi:hypothetical protein